MSSLIRLPPILVDASRRCLVSNSARHLEHLSECSAMMLSRPFFVVAADHIFSYEYIQNTVLDMWLHAMQQQRIQHQVEKDRTCGMVKLVCLPSNDPYAQFPLGPFSDGVASRLVCFPRRTTSLRLHPSMPYPPNPPTPRPLSVCQVGHCRHQQPGQH